MTHWRWADPTDVRSTIATLALHDQSADARLGEIVLREHQREAAGRLRLAIDRYGGALLADEVGLGKTFTALAAARDAATLLIVAPASLASMWRTALERSHLRGDFVSLETLSHRDAVAERYHFVIVDEAHHARNPLTRRYDRLAAITRDARVLLLSATPVHNAVRDLHALLALFLGARAQHLTRLDLASCIVRRSRDDIRDDQTPHRAPPVWLPVDDSADVLRAIAGIPAPCPPSDGGDGGALVGLSLVRAWASTEAALRSSLRRRIARADSLADALATGRHPTRAELRAWVVGDDATQLAFPELMAQSLAANEATLLEVVRAHASGARRALAVVNASGGEIDDRRAALIREIRRRHAGERIVVFSQFADSVHVDVRASSRRRARRGGHGQRRVGRRRLAQPSGGTGPVRPDRDRCRPGAACRNRRAPHCHRPVERRAESPGCIGRGAPGLAVDRRAPNAANGSRVAHRVRALAGARVRARPAGAGRGRVAGDAAVDEKGGRRLRRGGRGVHSIARRASG